MRAKLGRGAKVVRREWATGHPQYYLQNLAWSMLLIYALFVFALCGLFGVKDGTFPTSEVEPRPHPNSTFMLEVAANGETVFTAAENVSDAVRQEIFGTVYPSPEAAEEAASASLASETEPIRGPEWLVRTLGWFGISPASAHAVNVCTTAPSWKAKVSHNTGYGRHLSWRRKPDANGYRFTRTDHQVLSGPNYVWVSTATYLYKINKKYC